MSLADSLICSPSAPFRPTTFVLLCPGETSSTTTTAAAATPVVVGQIRLSRRTNNRLRRVRSHYSTTSTTSTTLSGHEPAQPESKPVSQPASPTQSIPNQTQPPQANIHLYSAAQIFPPWSPIINHTAHSHTRSEFRLPWTLTVRTHLLTNLTRLNSSNTWDKTK